MIDRGELPALRISQQVIRVPIAAFDLWREGYAPKRRRVTISEENAVSAIGADEELPERVRSITG